MFNNISRPKTSAPGATPSNDVDEAHRNARIVHANAESTTLFNSIMSCGVSRSKIVQSTCPIDLCEDSITELAVGVWAVIRPRFNPQFCNMNSHSLPVNSGPPSVTTLSGNGYRDNHVFTNACDASSADVEYTRTISTKFVTGSTIVNARTLTSLPGSCTSTVRFCHKVLPSMEPPVPLVAPTVHVLGYPSSSAYRYHKHSTVDESPVATWDAKNVA